MDYNSNREKMIMPEYGRNIQNMVSRLMKIEDRIERNKAAQQVIDVMGNLYPYLRDIPDFKHKLWDHIAIMSDFKLDIDYPYEITSPQILSEKPNTVPYPQSRFGKRHYGKIIFEMINQVVNYPEGEEKELTIWFIANHMKRSYKNWNKDHVEDDVILADFERFSGGKILFPPTYRLNDIKATPPPQPQQKKKNKKNGKR